MNAQFLRLCREFVAVRRHKFKSLPKEQPWGWREVGSGFYSEVWAHPDWPGLVLKISGPAGWGYDDPGTIRYNATSPDWDGVRADMWPMFASHCRAYPNPHFPQILHLERVTQRMCWGVMPRYRSSDYGEYADHEFANRVRKILIGETKPGPDDSWLWPLIEMSQHRYACVDLHSGNWMIDSAGRVVITDPFSAVGTSHTEGDTSC